MTAAMTASTLFGTGIPVQAADDGWIGDGELSDSGTAAPDPDEVLPSQNQYKYQKDELAAFCHFGPNTFNEIEWGEHYGTKTPDEIFKLEDDFQADKYVKALKDAGFKKLIVTAKHHDGFCIWASDYTTYDVAETSYKDGQGDILAEISAACTKYDMDMGLYLSPWDIHDESYGYYDQNGNPTSKDNDYLDYNEYYNNQLEEILGGEEYGNDGHFVEVWMDGAKGSGQDAQDYDFVKWFDTIQKYEGKEAGYDSDCMLFGAEAYTTVRWIGNENGYADKNTWSKSKVNYDNNTIDSNTKSGYTIGYEDGNQWTVPEADARITSGWFWGTTKNTPKSIADLGSMYFGSVGNNATFLLNIPPNNKGTVDQAILDRVAEFGDNIEETFDDNLAAAKGASVYADNVRGNDTAYKPGNTVDGNDSTYWTTEDGTNKGTLLIDLGGVKTFDVVSVEEAIQNGQRINEYKIEYRNSDGEWTVMDSGETIGAKRLCRTGAVKGDQVRITVSTTEGKVPMISEVGVYKASEGFELAGTAPDGMDVIDISNSNSFSFSNGWTDEKGTNFIGGTNKWANPGASFTLKFKGSKVYLLGTKDPNHGTADVYIDNELVETINTNASSRALGQMIFESDDLKDGEHTLRLEVKNKAIGIESAYVINNGGKGMIGLEADSYTMNEDSHLDVKLIRVGGSTGEVSVLVSPNPGSAIQDDFNTELNTVVTFADGQTEATAPVETRRNTNQTGDREFSIEVTSKTDDLIVGFNDKATITILDTESSSKEALQTLVDEGTSALSEWYTAGWDAYAAAVAEGAEVLADTEATADEIAAAISAITDAKEGLAAREQYTAEDPFVFPWQQNSSSVLEAEFAELNNVELTSDGQWALCVTEADWASNGKFVNCLNQQDTISIPYYAEKAGTYSFTAYYRSGDPKNALSWSEPDGKIELGSVTAGASDSAGATHEVTFDIVVKEAGAGTLVFTGPEKKSPQLDRFEIVPKEIELGEFTITASAGEGGTISDEGETAVTEGESKTYTITPEDGYKIADVKVNGESVGPVDTYTFESVSSDAVIEAVFEFSNYTEANPFNFPTEENGDAVILEAEYSILHNVELASDGQWALCVADADWASNGKFVNCLNQQDTISIPYYAEKAGTYSFTVYYRSGDPNNALSWTEENGKITSGSVTAGAGDSAGSTHQVTFDVEVTEAGAGTLVFTGPEKKSPQLDKFDIVLTEAKGETPETYMITASAGEGGTIDPSGEVTVNAGETQTFTITAEEGWHISDVKVNGESVGAVESYDMDAAGTIEASFEKDAVEPEPGKEISTAVLEYAIELAADVNTDGVIDAVKVNFENALQTAEDVLAKVQAGDTSVTQNDVDSAWQNLIKAMQYMEFKSADKKDLAAVIAAAEDINSRLDEYLDTGKDAFTSALATAQEVYEDELASQEEVNNAWMNLLNAMADMRLIPDKGLLEDLIAQAESLNEADYEAQSFAVMRTALAAAKDVLANENATKEEVEASEAALQDAIAGLTASGSGEAGNTAGGEQQQSGNAGSDDQSGAQTGNVNGILAQAGSSDSTSGGSSSAGSTSSANTSSAAGKSAKAVKTGDTENVLPFAAAAVLAAGAAVLLKKKEEN